MTFHIYFYIIKNVKVWGYVRKKRGTWLRHTPRWLIKSGENFLDPPLPCMFLLGEKLWVVRSCECSMSVDFRPS